MSGLYSHVEAKYPPPNVQGLFAGTKPRISHALDVNHVNVNYSGCNETYYYKSVYEFES